jgi:DNA-binding IclR family transcriptional regulator
LSGDRQRTTKSIQSIERAVTILRAFTEAEPELGVTELGRRLSLHKSTVSRILATLQQEGLVNHNPETGRYRLGLGIISLAGVALGRLGVRAVAQPHLSGLVAATEETVNVSVRDGRECVNIERARSPQPIRYVGWIGRRMPLHCTAAGQVLLAYLPFEAQADFLAGSLPAYTGRTVVDPEALKAILARICQQGHAIVHEEFEDGFSGIAAPIFNHIGQAVAAVSVSGPTYRMGPGKIERFVTPLKGTAWRISEEMGFR